MNELFDDDVIARLRSALDEVTAKVDGADSAASPSPHRSGIGAGRWLAIAAATILVVGAATAVVVNRNHAPEVASIPTDVVTTVPAPTTTTATTATEPTLIRTVTPWYTLASQDLVPGEITTVPNMLTNETSMVWALGGNPVDGLFILRSGPGSPDMAPADTSLADYQMIGDQAVAVSSYGIDAPQQADLLRQVQPGSGLPWVLPVDGWTLLGLGTGNDGPSQQQQYSSIEGEASILVGPLSQQFITLATLGGIEPVTVAGQDGWKVTSDGGVYVLWPAADSGQWASLTISASFADRVDGLIAAVAEVDPTQPTVETVPVPDTAAPQAGPIEDITAVEGTSLPLYDTSATDPAIGAMPPAFELVDGDGQPSSLLPGEVGPTMVVFVAEWDPHSQGVVALVQTATADGTIPGDEEVVLVVTASARDDALTWLAGQQWTGRVLIDTQEGARAAGQAANAFGASGWPFWVAVGSDGTVTARTAGELDEAALQTLVAPMPDGELGTLTIPAIGFDSVVVRSAQPTTAPHLLRGATPDAANTLAISMLDLGAAGAGLDTLQAGDQVTWTTENGTYEFVITRGIACTGADCGTEGDETLVLTTDGLLTRLFAVPAS